VVSGNLPPAWREGAGGTITPPQLLAEWPSRGIGAGFWRKIMGLVLIIIVLFLLFGGGGYYGYRGGYYRGGGLGIIWVILIVLLVLAVFGHTSWRYY
jgi:hypothetical protein